jgi:long-subunit acyl-CoA synthetase (AMP-forming)
MIDPTKRIAKWNTKFNTERIKATLDEMRPTMLANVTAVYPMITAMELQVKQVCDGAGVSVIQIPFYLNFGRELWALTRREVSGETLAIEAAVLIDKWKARGLTEAVLQAIRTDVFNVAAPIVP